MHSNAFRRSLTRELIYVLLMLAKAFRYDAVGLHIVLEKITFSSRLKLINLAVQLAG